MKAKKRSVERQNRIFGAITFTFFILGIISWIVGEISGKPASGGKVMVIFSLGGVIPLLIYLFKNRKRN